MLPRRLLVLWPLPVESGDPDLRMTPRSRTKVSGRTGEEPPCLAAFCGHDPWFLGGMLVQPGTLRESQDRLNLGSSPFSERWHLSELTEWGLNLLEVSTA